MKHFWFGGIETEELRLAGTPYEVWLQKKFKPFPAELRKLGITKWRRIRKWHLAERKVWRELYNWTTRRTESGRQRALLKLREAYDARNDAFAEAVKAHWPCTRLVHRYTKGYPADAVDMLSRHPNAFPPRH